MDEELARIEGSSPVDEEDGTDKLEGTSEENAGPEDAGLGKFGPENAGPEEACLEDAIGDSAGEEEDCEGGRDGGERCMVASAADGGRSTSMVVDDKAAGKEEDETDVSTPWIDKVPENTDCREDTGNGGNPPLDNASERIVPITPLVLEVASYLWAEKAEEVADAAGDGRDCEVDEGVLAPGDCEITANADGDQDDMSNINETKCGGGGEEKNKETDAKDIPQADTSGDKSTPTTPGEGTASEEQEASATDVIVAENNAKASCRDSSNEEDGAVAHAPPSNEKAQGLEDQPKAAQVDAASEKPESSGTTPSTGSPPAENAAENAAENGPPRRRGWGVRGLGARLRSVEERMRERQRLVREQQMREEQQAAQPEPGGALISHLSVHSGKPSLGVAAPVSDGNIEKSPEEAEGGDEEGGEEPTDGPPQASNDDDESATMDEGDEPSSADDASHDILTEEARAHRLRTDQALLLESLGQLEEEMMSGIVHDVIKTVVVDNDVPGGDESRRSETPSGDIPPVGDGARAGVWADAGHGNANEEKKEDAPQATDIVQSTE